MKKLIILLSFISLNVIAQPSSNYFTLITPIDISKQELYAGSSTSVLSTNTQFPLVSFLNGYLYPSNFSAYTTWQFPPRIIITTNAIISFHFLTTNTSTALSGTYRIILYTNNLVVPYYDSGDLTWSTNAPPFNTNLMIIHLTNNFPTNFLVYNTNYFTNMAIPPVITTNIYSKVVLTNMTAATISVKNGPFLAGPPWYTTWLAGGKIEFQ